MLKLQRGRLRAQPVYQQLTEANRLYDRLLTIPSLKLPLPDLGKKSNDQTKSALAAASITTPLAEEAVKVCRAVRCEQRRHRRRSW